MLVKNGTNVDLCEKDKKGYNYSTTPRDVMDKYLNKVEITVP